MLWSSFTSHIALYKTHSPCKMSETWIWYYVVSVASITSWSDYNWIMYHAVSVVKSISYSHHLALSPVLPEIHRLSWGAPSTSVYFRFFQTRGRRCALRFKTKVDLEGRKWENIRYCICDDWNVLVETDVFCEKSFLTFLGYFGGLKRNTKKNPDLGAPLVPHVIPCCQLGR